MATEIRQNTCSWGKKKKRGGGTAFAGGSFLLKTGLSQTKNAFRCWA